MLALRRVETSWVAVRLIQAMTAAPGLVKHPVEVLDLVPLQLRNAGQNLQVEFPVAFDGLSHFLEGLLEGVRAASAGRRPLDSSNGNHSSSDSKPSKQ